MGNKFRFSTQLIFGRILPILLFLAIYFITPIFASNYVMTIVNMVLIYFLGAIGISLLMGMGGHLSFASISFMGIGAFLAAQMAKTYGINPVLAIVLSVLFTSIFSFLLGLLLLRLSGPFFLFSTIAFAQIMANVFLTFKPLSNGADGVYGIPKMVLFGILFDDLRTWFYLLAVIVVIIALIVERIRRSVLGRSLMSIRDNEVAAKTLGVDVYRTKVIAFVIANAFAALGGAILSFHNDAVSASLFTLEISQRFLVMVMLGGVNSTFGTFLGTSLITALPEWLRPLQQYLNIFFGVGLILMMIYMPMGLTGIFTQTMKKITNKLRKRSEDAKHAVSTES